MSIQSPTSPLRVAFIFCLAALATPSHAQEKAGIGYGGAYVQLKPIMAPVRGPDGRTRFDVLTLRLVLDVGDRERPACFSAPIVHEKILLYLYSAGLTTPDLIGKRRDLLAKKLLEVAIAATAKGYYSEVEIVDQGKLEMEMKVAATKAKNSSGAATPQEQLENKSKTMTSQCQ
jgi:hypothetical protein